MLAAFNSILVALDGRQGGLDAAALAGLLAAPGAELALAHVLTSAEPANLAEAALERGRTEEALRLVRGDRSEPTDPPVHALRAPSVVAGLLELVRGHRAELLVVGAHHHRHLDLTHDHTRDALRRTPCALAVAPRGYSTRRIRALRSVGVGYVDDHAGRVVLDTARSLAWQLGAEVYATTIVPASNWPDADAATGWRAAAAARRMAEIPGVHGTAVEGAPQRVLASMSSDVDLLVIGSHHHGALRRLLSGDVADDLAHRSRCPLVVLPQMPRD